MSTSTQPRPTTPWVFRSICSPRFLPSAEFLDGRRTASNNPPTPVCFPRARLTPARRIRRRCSRSSSGRQAEVLGLLLRRFERLLDLLPEVLVVFVGSFF